jgi:pre-rRNA-processing protein TSR3
MFCFLPTVILRHRKENLKKCSLRGLESRDDCHFIRYPCKTLPPLEGYLLLDLEAPPLSDSDKDLGLFLIDATWRYATTMSKNISLPETMVRRSLPKQFVTAYPRYQTGCIFPEQGLASVEALYLAYLILGRSTEGILDNYHWKIEFLKKNGLELGDYLSKAPLEGALLKKTALISANTNE